MIQCAPFIIYHLFSLSLSFDIFQKFKCFFKNWKYLFKAAYRPDWFSGYRQSSLASSIHRQYLAPVATQPERMLGKLSGRTTPYSVRKIYPHSHLCSDSALKLWHRGKAHKIKARENILMIWFGKFHISHWKIRLNIDFYQFSIIL